MRQNLGNELFLAIFWRSGRVTGQNNPALIEYIQNFKGSFMIGENLSFLNFGQRFETRDERCLRSVPKKSNRTMIPLNLSKLNHINNLLIQRLLVD